MNYKTILEKLELVTEVIGRSAALLSLLLMLITVVVVIMRYGFEAAYLPIFGLKISSIALQESVIYLHATLFMLASGYTLKHNEHVRVDVFYREFSPRTKAYVDIFGSLTLLIPVASFILYTSLDYVDFAWRIKEKSQEAQGLPYVWLLKTLIPTMAVVLIFQGILEIGKNVGFLLHRYPQRYHQPHPQPHLQTGTTSDAAPETIPEATQGDV
jgi:TRAP-type mannitol/chloroaromatic compound transport system permease small subunit